MGQVLVVAVFVVLVIAAVLTAGYSVGYENALIQVCDTQGGIWVSERSLCITELDTINLVD